MKFISIITPAYNEEENIEELHARVANVMSGTNYKYEHILIDNCSTDNTYVIAKRIAQSDKNFKLISNNRNFGHIRSPYHGLLQASGDAAILIASDLQDPPELIIDFINEWEKGNKLVFLKKIESEENKIMWKIRSLYYYLLSKISDAPLLNNVTGAGLYDREVIECLRKLDDPYPYFRGLISEIGCRYTTVNFSQPKRIRGVTKNNFLTLYDMAILGITTNSRVPLHVLTLGGFLIAGFSLLVSLAFFVIKLFYWNTFEFGLAPILVGMFFLGGLQLFFLGLIGEYVGIILTKIRKVPHVYERERINF